MTIRLKKILTATAQDYNGKGTLHDKYKMVGVHFSFSTTDENEAANAIKHFAKKVPKSAEVVVNYDMKISTTYTRKLNSLSGNLIHHTSYFIVMSGTALIPKKNK